ncbi:hypothetical protein [Thermoactinomyces vulgaris]|uniref:hypothetical protein n=1 Tax=Thermoactinomyces vulgaris TaxID=2026 RepID=UPI003634ECB5
MKKSWNRHHVKTGLIGLLLVLLSMPFLSGFSDHVLLTSLSKYNIFQITKDLVGLTDRMIDETEALEDQVKQAGQSLGVLDRQLTLADQQIRINQGIRSELESQLQGNISARDKMEEILIRQKETSALTGQVSARTNEISGQMEQVIGDLGNVAAVTGDIGKNSQQLHPLMDDLMVELNKSYDNLRFIRRIVEWLDDLKRKIGLSGSGSGQTTGGESHEDTTADR